MSIDLKKLSTNELFSIIKQAVEIVDQKAEFTIDHAYQEFERFAKMFKMSPTEFFEAWKFSKRKTIRERAVLNPVEAKYKHPTDKEITWSGRGKTPNWMLELIEKGANKDDFLIKRKK